MELGIPIAEWIEQIVLPVDAVVCEGIDSFVFQQNGDHFDRVPVHEKHRNFLPPFNEGAIQLNVLLPPGTSLATSLAINKNVEVALTA